MADLTITAANVTPGSGATYGIGIAGTTITAGQTLFTNSSNQLVLANAVTSIATAACVGISAHAALTGQRLSYYNQGQINFGAILLAGKWYVVSGANSGGIAPVADLASTWFSSLLGYGISTSVLQLAQINTGIVLA